MEIFNVKFRIIGGVARRGVLWRSGARVRLLHQFSILNGPPGCVFRIFIGHDFYLLSFALFQTYPPGQNLSTTLHIHERCYDCHHGLSVGLGGCGDLTKASLLAQRGYGGAQSHGPMRPPIQRKFPEKFGAAGRKNRQNDG